jgi:hypothetical protein
LTSKPLERFLQFGLKTGGDCFLVEPQNQEVVKGFSIWASKPTATVW